MKTVTEKQDAVHPGKAVVPVLIGVIGSIIVSMLLLVLFSMILSAKDLPSGANLPFACTALSGGSICGGLLTARLYRSRGLMIGAIQGLAFFLLMYLTGAIMRQADLNAMLLLKLALSVAFGAVGGIAGVNIRRRR